MFHLFQLYVANVLSLCFKSRLGVAHVAMRADRRQTMARHSRLVLLPRRRCGLRAGRSCASAGWARQAWCCCRGHHRGSRANTGAWYQTLARDADSTRDAMRAGVGCRRRALSGRTLPSERDLARGEGSCIRQVRVWKLHPDGRRVPDIRALVVR